MIFNIPKIQQITNRSPRSEDITTVTWHKSSFLFLCVAGWLSPNSSQNASQRCFFRWNYFNEILRRQKEEWIVVSGLKNRNYVRLFPASVGCCAFHPNPSFHVLHVHIAPLWGPQSQSRPHQEVDPTRYDEKTVQCVEKESNATRKNARMYIYIIYMYVYYIYRYILIYIPWIQHFLKGLLVESKFSLHFPLFSSEVCFFIRLRPHPSAPLVASPVEGFTGSQV